MSGIAKTAPTLVAAALTLAAALALAPAPASAQATGLKAGDRVRITYSRTERQVGTVVRVSGDTVVIDSRGSTLAIPLSSASRVEVSRGRASAGRGMARVGGLGLVGGAAVGGILGAATYRECEGFCIDFGQGGAALAGAVAGGAVGGLVGGLAGATWPGTRWERVRPGAPPAVAAVRAGVEIARVDPARQPDSGFHLLQAVPFDPGTAGLVPSGPRDTQMSSTT